MVSASKKLEFASEKTRNLDWKVRSKFFVQRNEVWKVNSQVYVQRNEVWKLRSQVCVQRNKVLKLRKKFVFRDTRLEAENPGGV